MQNNAYVLFFVKVKLKIYFKTFKLPGDVSFTCKAAMIN